MTYQEDELLPLSGIHHFLFCRRSWALITVEQQWDENIFTIKGHEFHKRVDDPFENQSGPSLIVSRSLPVRSFKLGLTGVCDLVEFHPSKDGVNLAGHSGLWKPVPIEYKRGLPKPDARDEVQLCAQAICLEEMLSVSVEKAFLYYGKTRHRTEVVLDRQLRDLVANSAKEMHQLYARGYTPKARYKKECKSCSLVEICFPTIQTEASNVKKYMQRFLEEDQ